MSTISGGSGSQRSGSQRPAPNGDVLNQLKDQYESRERQIEHRHREDVTELNKAHQAEIDRLHDENNQRVRAVQDEANAKLNQKDLQYQKEAEAIRSMYAKRLSDAKKAPGSA